MVRPFEQYLDSPDLPTAAENVGAQRARRTGAGIDCSGCRYPRTNRGPIRGCDACPSQSVFAGCFFVATVAKALAELGTAIGMIAIFMAIPVIVVAAWSQSATQSELEDLRVATKNMLEPAKTQSWRSPAIVSRIAFRYASPNNKAEKILQRLTQTRWGMQTPTTSSHGAIGQRIHSRSLEAVCGLPNRDDLRLCVVS
jgi:hypothetical protein